MKKLISILLILFFITPMAFSQKYITKNGKISFYSDAPMEKIEAHNSQVNAALDASTGDLVFRVLMKSFIFEKALMQEHFNENYVESDKYPNSTFKGKIQNIKNIDFTKNGKHNVIVEGDLTIHGVTQKVKHPGTIEIKDGKVIAMSKFSIELKDYNIKIPKNVLKNIAEIIEITVNVNMDKTN
jgi:polyisoprenoid-binding protein YceI